MKTILTATALTAMACSTAYAQLVYTPNVALPDQKISLKPWGSGTIAETTEMAFQGTSSIRVSSRNFFQGGIILFGDGLDLSKATADNSNMLLLTLQAATASLTLGSTSRPGRGGRGGDDGGDEGGSGPAVIDATLTKVRCVITTTDGKKSEVYIDLLSAIPNSRGWKTVGVPLVSIPGFEKSNKTLKSISFSGDTIGTFYVGELRVLNDTSPLYVEPTIREMNLALGDEVSITALGSGGASQLKYTWDFDSRDGVDVDAEGMTIKRRFRKDGTFTITLTVHDAFGLKKPYSTTILVTINP